MGTRPHANDQEHNVARVTSILGEIIDKRLGCKIENPLFHPLKMYILSLVVHIWMDGEHARGARAEISGSHLSAQLRQNQECRRLGGRL
jgi:hypothetical protein